MSAKHTGLTEDVWPFGHLSPRSYGVVVADPPWNFRSYAPVTNPHIDRNPDRHYETMNIAAIKALPVKDLAAKDCHLFLWVTGPYLMMAEQVIKAWGFRYSGVAFTWIKLKRSHKADQFRFTPTLDTDFHVGLGYTTRKNSEYCLLARRGSPRRIAKNVRELIIAPVREHSRKPEEFRDRVEQYVGPGIPIVELFARSPRSGWDAWGNEVNKFEAAA